MNNLDKQYTDLLQYIIDNGIQKSDRTGTGTLSVFGRQIRHNMKQGFPLLTTKKMAWKSVVTELLWFLKGDTNIKYLVDNDCHIWDGDAYKKYKTTNPDFLANDEMFETVDKPTRTFRYFTKEEFINKIKTDDEFAKQWGELGPIYGKQWRKWNKIRFRNINRINQHQNQIAGIENSFEEEGKWVRGYEDQIANLINELKTNPDSRRLMVSAWNVGELDQMVLPPCHYGFQVYTRELSYEERKEILYSKFRKEPIVVNGESYIECAPTDINFEFFNIPSREISLMWNQRSVDVPLGLPFNIASYGLLLEIIAREVNMIPDELIGNLGDCHIYKNQIEGVKEQITRTPYELPKLNIKLHFENKPSFVPDQWLVNDFTIENYQSHSKIKIPLSN